MIIRHFFPADEAGVRVGTVLMATVFGMALGGWMSGVIFDRSISARIRRPCAAPARRYRDAS